jgi:hypothetical protein
VRAVHLREVLDAGGGRHGEVHGLLARRGERMQGVLGELGEGGAQAVAVREAHDGGAGADLAARAAALDQAVASERTEQAGGRALGQAGGPAQLADGDLLGTLEDQRQELGRALDRLRTPATHNMELMFHGGAS